MISFYPYQYRHDVPAKAILTEPETWLMQYFNKPECHITTSGREAISILMRNIRPNLEDEIYITTSFNFPNVSSCVTSTIFNYCKPSRVLSDHTRAIFIIHEFGVPHPDLLNLRKIADQRGIILIEDLAHTINSRVDSYRVGELSDYLICSFPKIFPVPAGGALVGKTVNYSQSHLDMKKCQEVRRGIAPYLPMSEEYACMRRDVYKKMLSRFKSIGLFPLFEISENITPWFFPIPMKQWQYCVTEAPKYGIDCGHWHGTNIVVFPCNQFIQDSDIDHMADFLSVVDKVASGSMFPSEFPV